MEGGTGSQRRRLLVLGAGAGQLGLLEAAAERGLYVEIWLPEEDAVAALHQLVKLDEKHKLLSREFGVVDLRLPDKLYLRKRGPGDATPGPV